jgi:lipoprotein-anchoring transpeptidase ErfK/SrfK
LWLLTVNDMRNGKLLWGVLVALAAAAMGTVLVVAGIARFRLAPSASPSAEALATQPYTPVPTSKAPPGWATYVNPAYGFSFRYPPAWSVEELPADDAHSGAVRFRLRTLRLTVAYRRVGDDSAMVRDQLVGEWEPGEAVPFAGQDLRLNTLAHEGRVKGVRYGPTDRPVRVEGVEFLLTLHDAAIESCTGVFDAECGYHLIDIPADLRAEAGEIVSSFAAVPISEPVDAYPGWAGYVRASHGFSFRYPPDWSLVEGRNYVALGRGTLNLVIGYRLASEDVNICCRTALPEGEVTAIDTVDCLEQEVERAQLTCEDKTKVVLYNSMDEIQVGDLMFFITAEDSAPDYDSASIPESVLVEIDRIVMSLETFARVPDLSTPVPTPTPPAPTLLPPTSTPAPEPARVVAGEAGVNVRSGPGTTYAVLGYLAAEEQASVTGRYGDWWQIAHAGGSGWVFGGVVTAFDVDSVPKVESPPTPVPASPTLIPTPIPLAELGEGRWIDVDLSEQLLTAYEGWTPVRTTLVSTGLPRTPTVTGQFRIWIKLRYDDMAGPGYYIEDVPFVMYFYQGYGLHGAPWHNNFGHPMSHGCVNLSVPEAEWLFGFADVGTLVNVHE